MIYPSDGKPHLAGALLGQRTENLAYKKGVELVVFSMFDNYKEIPSESINKIHQMFQHQIISLNDLPFEFRIWNEMVYVSAVRGYAQDKEKLYRELSIMHDDICSLEQQLQSLKFEYEEMADYHSLRADYEKEVKHYENDSSCKPFSKEIR